MRRIALSNVSAQPWKNGGGVTRELLREGTGPCGFALRVSVANVDQGGSFSVFPGVDRVIAMLEGNGFVLSRSGLTVELGAAPWAFPGEDAWECVLVDGPVRDLNVMVDRTQLRASMVRRAKGDTVARLLVVLNPVDDLERGDLLVFDSPTPAPIGGWEITLVRV